MLQLKNTTTHHHRKATTMIKIAYTTNSGPYARDYVATVGQHRINLYKVNSSDYIPWCVFIYSFDGPTPVESATSATVLHTYAYTLAEAKQIAEEFIEAKLAVTAAV